jgi:hypothetical protein
MKMVFLISLIFSSSAFAGLTCEPRSPEQKAAMEVVARKADKMLDCLQDLIRGPRATGPRVEWTVSSLNLILSDIRNSNTYDNVYQACKESLKEVLKGEGQYSYNQEVLDLGRLANESPEAAQMAFQLLHSSYWLRVVPGNHLYNALLNKKHCEAEGLPLDKVVVD